MIVEIIKERLARYACKSTLEEELALREITQEIVLAGLGRTDLFARAAFQGGTCLRIFHGLNRFSEDLDFALDAPDRAFQISPYLDHVRQELAAYGYDLKVGERRKAGGPVRVAFLKDDSVSRLLSLEHRPRAGPMRKLRIKLEVDTEPPAGATYDMPFLDFPFPAAVRVFDLPSLFAGKLHALLCRDYLKGRDWYDFLWYTARRTPINHELLSAALDQQGPWKDQAPKTDDPWCIEHLGKMIARIDWMQAQRDVQRFLKPIELPSLKLWTREFFLERCARLGE